MVEVSKSFMKKVITKNLEYQDYNNLMTIFITILVSLVILLVSFIVFFWKFLSENPIWFSVIGVVFIGFELIFFFLLFYFNKQKKEKRNEIEKLR